jgi:3-dehydroquinate dehydratase / shikimate dehydrogenase
MGDFLSTYSGTAVCAVVGAATMEELRQARDRVSERADLVEIRLDAAPRPDPAAALQGRTRPVVVTCRPAWEGGGFTGSETERLDILRRAWSLGADAVDLEARAEGAPAFLRETGGERIVLSIHDYSGVPTDLLDRLRSMASTPAAIVKLAVQAHRLADCEPIFGLSRSIPGRRFIGIAMGASGVTTRILAGPIGSAWTYAGDGWAPGQVPLDSLLDEFRFRELTTRTAIYGVVGRPIGHSLSPAMHNAAFASEGSDVVYVPLEPESADDAIQFAEARNIGGLSVTAPFKVALVAHATLDATATRIGALNTLRCRDGRWEATNTDPEGFMAPLAESTTVAGLRAAVLGTGGAARSVALALVEAGARVTVHGRDLGRAQAVAQLTGASAQAFQPAAGSWDLLVNTTPVGTTPASSESPLPDGPFDGALVYDLVYNPPITRLLQDAAKAGCRVLGGLDMLVAQAQAQRQWWTGRRGDAAVMKAAALRRLQTAAGPRPAGAASLSS